MKKQTLIHLFALITLTVLLASCSSLNQTMREPNTRVELQKEDFTLSDQVSGEATCTKIFGIDFDRLFSKKSGSITNGVFATPNIANIPVIGSMIIDPTVNYALYDMMQKTPGYDVVFYPQYTVDVSKPIGLGFIYKITKVNATARLGKLNK